MVFRLLRTYRTPFNQNWQIHQIPYRHKRVINLYCHVKTNIYLKQKIKYKKFL